MKVVVDTNIVFSAMLKADGTFARLLLAPNNPIEYYSTQRLYDELIFHKEKIKSLGDYNEVEFLRLLFTVNRKIRIISQEIVGAEFLSDAFALTHDIDEDDTEFVALTNFIEGRLWTGDKALRSGLKAKGWNKFINSDQIYKHVANSR